MLTDTFYFISLRAQGIIEKAIIKTFDVLFELLTILPCKTFGIPLWRVHEKTMHATTARISFDS